MHASQNNSFMEKRWAFAAIIIGFLAGFLSAFICVAFHLVIFGFNIMYIISPLIAGIVETIIARRKYGRTTGAISALLIFILINIYGWLLPGWLYPKEPATLSLITLIAILLMLQAAFPTFINYLLLIFGVGLFRRIIEFMIFLPARIQGTLPQSMEKEIITGPSADEIFLNELNTPLLSISPVKNGKIKDHLGLVTGLAVVEEDNPEGRLLKLSKIIQPVRFEDIHLGEARKIAISRMLEEAESIGANRVIEVLIDYVSMAGLQGSAVIVTATGTAVLYE